MKKLIGKNSEVALVNEYKGNLFEFMVALEVAKNLNIESRFFKKISPCYLALLREYQKGLFLKDRRLALFLQEYSQVLAEDILRKYPCEWEDIGVMGKIGASDMSLLGEVDLFLQHADKFLGISLKISKKGSFTNTKSGGIRSFFTRYFSSSLGERLQKKLNYIQNIEFQNLSRQLEALKGLRPTEDFSSWREEGLSELPGNLEGEAREILKSYYKKILDEVFDSLSLLFLEDKNSFKRSILVLMGFENPELIQTTFFYSEKGGEYHYEGSSFMSSSSFSMEKIRLEKGGGSTSLYIIGSHWKFQLRVKPMNVFTQKAIKLNGSLAAHLF